MGGLLGKITFHNGRWPFNSRSPTIYPWHDWEIEIRTTFRFVPEILILM